MYHCTISKIDFRIWGGWKICISIYIILLYIIIYNNIIKLIIRVFCLLHLIKNTNGTMVHWYNTQHSRGRDLNVTLSRCHYVIIWIVIHEWQARMVRCAPCSTVCSIPWGSSCSTSQGPVWWCAVAVVHRRLLTA